MSGVIGIDLSNQIQEKFDKLSDTMFDGFVCNTLYTTYETLTKPLDGLIVSASQTQKMAMSGLDKIPLDALLTLYNAVMDFNLPSLELPDTIGVGAQIDLTQLKAKCPYFKDIFPDSIAAALGINLNATGVIDTLNNYLAMPSNILNGMQIYLQDEIQKALKQLYGPYEYLFALIYQYEKMLKDAGIINMLEQMYKFEYCLINLCSLYEEEDFFMTDTQIKKSEYYADVLLVPRPSYSLNVNKFVSEKSTDKGNTFQLLYIKYKDSMKAVK